MGGVRSLRNSDSGEEEEEEEEEEKGLFKADAVNEEGQKVLLTAYNE